MSLFIIPVNKTDQAVQLWRDLRTRTQTFLNPVYRNHTKRFKIPYHLIRVLLNGVVHKISKIFALELVQGFMGVLLKYLKGVPVIIYVIDDTLELRLTRKRPLNRVKQKILQRLQMFTIRHADQIITVNEEITEWIKKTGNPKVVTQPYGKTPFTNYSKEKSVAIREKYFGCHELVFGYAGGFQPHHGVQLIIDAAKILHREREDVKFYLIGGPGSRWLAPNIFQEKRVDQKDLFTYINVMDVCICPPIPGRPRVSLVTNKLLEYASMGKPIIVTRTGALPHLCAKWGFGLVSDPDPDSMAKKIIEMAGLKHKWSEMGDNARRMLETDYNWLKNKEKIISLILDEKTGSTVPPPKT
ncbi:MAG: glycosyltransferase family 4 protein [Candidatus Ranarchaeia archaeon]